MVNGRGLCWWFGGGGGWLKMEMLEVVWRVCKWLKMERGVGDVWRWGCCLSLYT